MSESETTFEVVEYIAQPELAREQQQDAEKSIGIHVEVAKANFMQAYTHPIF